MGNIPQTDFLDDNTFVLKTTQFRRKMTPSFYAVMRTGRF